jgi:hypothetical protein
MNASSRSHLAVLGTLSELHHEPIAYDLTCLRRLVTEVAPDILCAEITRDAWEAGDLSHTPLEVREALALIESSTDIVLVPVAASQRQFVDFTPQSGWRRGLVQLFGRVLQWGQRRANRPEAINGFMFGAFCHTVCWLIEKTWAREERTAWEAQNRAIGDNIFQAVQRDPGRRVLVVVQCQRLHPLVQLLKTNPEEIEIVGYQEL